MKRKPKILYIDDEDHCLRTFKANFRRCFQIFTASSALEGLKILEEVNNTEDELSRIQVIVSDQRMVNMTGSKLFCETVKTYPNTQRIILTGFSDKEDLEEAIEKGKILTYHSKPFDETKLRLEILCGVQIYQLKIRLDSISSALNSIQNEIG